MPLAALAFPDEEALAFVSVEEETAGELLVPAAASAASDGFSKLINGGGTANTATRAPTDNQSRGGSSINNREIRL